MQINTSIPKEIMPLVNCLKTHEVELSLTDSLIYFDFPVYKELDESILVAQVMLLSQRYGVLLFKVAQHTDGIAFDNTLKYEIDNLNNLYSMVFSRLLRNEKLKIGRQAISVPITTFLYAPFIVNLDRQREKRIYDDVIITYTESQLLDCIPTINSSLLSCEVFNELQSSIEGSKGLIVPNKRSTTSENTKAYAANHAEQEITLFDMKQKTAYLTPITGVSRIRGLAGSGKTVILCMKAALLHLREPNAKILYTFYTKSLYQHVRRLITRFYRQYNDQDPDWDKIQIRHGWGTNSLEGVYSLACDYHGIAKLTFGDARTRRQASPFDFVCKDFISKVPNPNKMYDYILIDEGQDFPISFIRMCLGLVDQNRVLFAYDDLQTIFQNHAPTSVEIFGQDSFGNPLVDFTEDTVLPKCYRNPREILVVAHAIGFGIYASSISQMIESPDYWSEIGYEIKEGELREGSMVSILRPERNSLKSISDRYDKSEIVRYKAYNEFKDEILDLCECINDDIKEQNLNPEDIMVLTADDKNASSYLNTIERYLAVNYDIMCNNVHADKFSVGNFQEKGRVTLSTIHKAKGNEAYSVYIVGIDALIPAKTNYRARNLLFTAMTRAKGWVRLSGEDDIAQIWCDEIQKALDAFPYLKFKYPSADDIKLMKRDMADESIRENRRKRMIDELLEELTPDEVKMYIDQQMKQKE